MQGSTGWPAFASHDTIGLNAPMSKPLKDKIALVTGASRGIGREAAKALAAAGAHVIALARTVGGLEDLDDEIQRAGGSATLVPLDLKDFEALDRLGASIFERWGRLDALFANAGVLGAISPLSHLEPKVFQELLDINVTANWRLIRSLDPLLKRSEAGRALFVSSGAARMHRPYWGGYAMAKAALESLALTYAAECAGTNVRVNILNPGPVRTTMRARAFPGEDPMSLPPPEALGPLIVEMLSPAYDKNGEWMVFAH
jgi:NAD(P)-dependent dehydrogenase (short-subunit alcohol dehydrogenase family)